MILKQTIRRILREDKKTKSTNKEFSKYKDSKFNSLREYTLQDIVDNWDSLSDHKNENIKTIKHFINNPDKITDLVYDEKGLEDGYHRLIAAKILKKPRFSYGLVENLKESIRRILREESEIPQAIKRRVSLINLEVNRLMKKVYTPDKCGEYKNGEELLSALSYAVLEDMYFSGFEHIDDTSVEWGKIADFIYVYIDKKYGKDIINYYQINCGNINETIKEESSNQIDNKVKDIILNGDDFDDWIRAIRLKYGDVVPLYHATTEETAEIIDKYGFKLVYGKNYKSFGKEPILYFQIGKSDYVASNRPILYRLDVPIDFLYNADIDMDGPNISDETLFKYVDEETWDDLPYEIKDAITYFIWNDFKLDGTEIFITDRFMDKPGEDIFKGLTPKKIKK